MTWETAPQPVTIRTERRIDVITGYVVLEEVSTDDLEITSHPVQRGADITDHAYLKPAALAIRFLQGETPSDSLGALYQKVLVLQAERRPFSVITGKRIYQNMLLSTVVCNTDKATENVLSVSCQLREVRIVDVVTTTIPPRAKQKTPGKTGATQRAGTKQLQKEGEGTAKERSVSLLKSGRNAVSGLFQ